MGEKEEIFFPYEKVRPVQDELMKLIYDTIKNKKNLIVHAPTGLGKTSASLAPALGFAINKNLTIFFLTSRHTQHKIVIETLRSIKEKSNADFAVTDMIGKKGMCASPGVAAFTTRDFME